MSRTGGNGRGAGGRHGEIQRRGSGDDCGNLIGDLIVITAIIPNIDIVGLSVGQTRDGIGGGIDSHAGALSGSEPGRSIFHEIGGYAVARIPRQGYGGTTHCGSHTEGTTASATAAATQTQRKAVVGDGTVGGKLDGERTGGGGHTNGSRPLILTEQRAGSARPIVNVDVVATTFRIVRPFQMD